MANILYRETDVPQVRIESSVKASELTYEELDTNFKLIDEELQEAKQDISDNESSKVIKQCLYATYSTNEDLTGIIPLDNTIPQNTEGSEIIDIDVTPLFDTTDIVLEFNGMACATTDGVFIISIFMDNEVNAIASTATFLASQELKEVRIKAIVPSTDLALRNYSIRVGMGAANTFRLNGDITSGLFGGTNKSTLVVTEVK